MERMDGGAVEAVAVEEQITVLQQEMVVMVEMVIA
jgi:hypothetical protein